MDLADQIIIGLCVFILVLMGYQEYMDWRIAKNFTRDFKKVDRKIRSMATRVGMDEDECSEKDVIHPEANLEEEPPKRWIH